ncbi:NnrS family protein [Methylogaea oryzae]
MTAAFCLLTLGAALRLIAPVGGALMGLSAVLWLVSYGLFLWRYAPILLAPRRG